jgi:hypothetical protein
MTHIVTDEYFKSCLVEWWGMPKESVDKLQPETIDALLSVADEYAAMGNDYGTSIIKSVDRYIAYRETNK